MLIMYCIYVVICSSVLKEINTYIHLIMVEEINIDIQSMSAKLCSTANPDY